MSPFTRDATVKAAIRFAPLLAFLLLSLVGFNLCLTILQRASLSKGRRLDIQVRCHETLRICLTNHATGSSRRERVCY